MSEAVAMPLPRFRLQELIELGKPRLSGLVLFTAGLGLAMAPAGIGWIRGSIFLISTAALVMAANTLNCVMERDVDARMHRTRTRPLPEGRIGTTAATISGVALTAASLVGLALAANLLTALLGSIAFVTYVAIYTPMKRWTAMALYVGGIPGAMPPLMGWTAGTGSLGTEGIWLFAFLFAWQLPHFLAIALYLKEDYARGGLQVFTVAYGDAAARRNLLATALLLAVTGVAPQYFGFAGTVYTVVAAILGAIFVAYGIQGVVGSRRGAWARRVFFFSLFYLPLAAGALLLTRALF